MQKKSLSKILTAAVLLVLSFGNYVVPGQTNKTGSTAGETVQQTSRISYIDAPRAGLSDKQILQCGPASATPSASANGAFVKVDLSFGLIPPSPEMVGARERSLGSWAVRNIYPAEAGRPETVASIYFDGFLTSGALANLKGGGRGYDVYGSANFTGSLCESRANYETRYYARFTGACGLYQEITFELSRRPPVDDGIGPYFREEDIYARGVFRGNVDCGTTGDLRRVRTDLSRRR
jgi:hypothetical protein